MIQRTDSSAIADEPPAPPGGASAGEAPRALTQPVIRERIRTNERRYHAMDVRALYAYLLERGAPLEYVPGQKATDIRTVYLDTREGTWSVDRSLAKFRCKRYDEPGPYWFEVKRRKGLAVEKSRQAIAPEALTEVLQGIRRGPALQRLIGSARLLPLVAVCYRRIAFEWPDVRVTLDRDLRFHSVHPGTPWTLGPCIGRKVGYVIEVKSAGALPDWLQSPFAGRAPETFSKSKWALVARRTAGPA